MFRKRPLEYVAMWNRKIEEKMHFDNTSYFEKIFFFSFSFTAAIKLICQTEVIVQNNKRYNNNINWISKNQITFSGSSLNVISKLQQKIITILHHTTEYSISKMDLKENNFEQRKLTPHNFSDISWRIITIDPLYVCIIKLQCVKLDLIKFWKTKWKIQHYLIIKSYCKTNEVFDLFLRDSLLSWWV